MARALILSGGVAHDYARTSPMLAEILQEVDIDVEIHEALDVLRGEVLAGFDMLVLNCVRWTCDQTPDWRDQWRSELPVAAQQALLKFLGAGRGLLALHAATICFDDWPEFRNILGAWWEWGAGNSGHAPLQEHRMRVVRTGHAVTEGLSDFAIVDELYTNPRITDFVTPLIEADWEGTSHPILWTRQYGDARVCYNALGHGVEAFANAANRVLLQRAAMWVLREPLAGAGCPHTPHSTGSGPSAARGNLDFP